MAVNAGDKGVCVRELYDTLSYGANIERAVDLVVERSRMMCNFVDAYFAVMGVPSLPSTDNSPSPFDSNGLLNVYLLEAPMPRPEASTPRTVCDTGLVSVPPDVMVTTQNTRQGKDAWVMQPGSPAPVATNADTVAQLITKHKLGA